MGLCASDESHQHHDEGAVLDERALTSNLSHKQQAICDESQQHQHEGAILDKRALISNLESRKQAICLITVVGADAKKREECGTGSLVEWPPNSKQLCVLTNRHVLPTAAIADKAQVVFRWQSAEGEFLNKKNYPREVRLDSSQLFLASAELDAALVAIDDSYRTVLSQVKPVLLDSREPYIGEYVNVIGHPAGALEQQRSSGPRARACLN